MKKENETVRKRKWETRTEDDREKLRVPVLRKKMENEKEGRRNGYLGRRKERRLREGGKCLCGRGEGEGQVCLLRIRMRREVKVYEIVEREGGRGSEEKKYGRYDVTGKRRMKYKRKSKYPLPSPLSLTSTTLYLFPPASTTPHLPMCTYLPTSRSPVFVTTPHTVYLYTAPLLVPQQSHSTCFNHIPLHLPQPHSTYHNHPTQSTFLNHPTPTASTLPTSVSTPPDSTTPTLHLTYLPAPTNLPATHKSLQLPKRNYLRH